MVEYLPEMQETRVQSLCQEYPLEKGMEIHPNILAWRIPWTEKPVRVVESQRVRHNWASNTHTHQNYWTTIVAQMTVLRIRVYEGEAGDRWTPDQEASSFPVAWYSKIGEAEPCPDKKIRYHIFLSLKVKETSAKKFLGGQKGSDV